MYYTCWPVILKYHIGTYWLCTAARYLRLPASALIVSQPRRQWAFAQLTGYLPAAEIGEDEDG
jgi:hypothetical protein